MAVYKTNIGVYQRDNEVAVPGYFWNIGVNQTDVPSEPPEPPEPGQGSIFVNAIFLGTNI